MSEFRKLFRAKRILAMILAVAVTVTSIPATANAAPLQTQGEAGLAADEADDGQQADSQDTSSGELEEQDGDSSASGGSGEDSEAGDQSKAEDSTDAGESTDAGDHADAAGSTDAGDNTDAGNVPETGETADGTDPSDRGDGSGADDNAAAGGNGADKDIAADGENGSSVATAEIVVDDTGIGSHINYHYGEYRYDTETKTIIYTYSKDSVNPFADIVSDIKERYIHVNLDHNENAALKAHLHYSWTDSAGSALEGAGPSDAGDYRLKVTLPTVAGLYDQEEIVREINFRIDRRDAGIAYHGSTSVVPGTLVGAVKADVKQGYTLSMEGMLLDSGNKAAYVQNNEVTIKDAHSNSALDDSYRLVKTEDYVVELTIVLKEEYAKNYNITGGVANIDMDGIIATEITVQNHVNQDGSHFGKVYDAKCIDEAAVKELLGETAVTEAESGESIPDAEITYTWFDANRTELESCAQAIDAGTYYLVLGYAGKEGLYQAADQEIMVVISTADIALEPVLKAGVTFYAGMTMKDILRKAVDTYNVHQMNPRGGMTDEAFTAAVKADPYFWGISYNDTGKTQSYEPVFAVEEGIVARGEDGKETISWNVIDDDTEALVKADDVKYRIVFSGKKAVYNSNGAEQKVDINASQENYRVDLSKETLEQYAKEITVTESDPADIDVSAMYKPAFCTNTDAEAGSRFDNAIRRDYSGEQLFTKRNEYKLAKVKSGGTPLAENTDARITYTWQYFTGEYHYFYQNEEGIFVDDDGEAIDAGDSRYIAGTDEDGGSVLIEPLYEDYNYYGYDPDVEHTSTPGEAGDYRLEVSFADPQKQYYADSKYVYYTIQKKNVQVQLTGTLEEYEGVSVGDFLDKIAYTYGADGTRSYVKHRIVGGTVSASQDGTYTFTPDSDGMSIDLPEWDYYTLDWYVERQIKEGTEAGTYVRLSDSDVLLKGETYRLGVEISDVYDHAFFDTNYNNRYAIDEHNARKTDADGNDIIAYDNEMLDITVNESEGIRLHVEVDWSKVSDTAKIYDGKSFSFTDTGIRDAVIVTNPKDGSLVDDADVTLQWLYQYGYSSRYVDEDNAIHVGDYYLYVTVEQDARYARGSYLFQKESDKKFTIVPRALTVTPVLQEEIKAGAYISSSADAAGKICAADPKVTGYEGISADRKFFEEDKIYVAGSVFRPYAFSNLSLSLFEKTARNPFTGYLRSSKSYNVSYAGALRDIYDENDVEQMFWARDYQVVFETVAFTPVRGTSSVESTAANNIAQTRLNDSISGDAKGGYTHTITPREGVVYTAAGYYEDENGERKALKGNYFVFQITAPDEYIGVADAAAKVIYENSIQDKGYVLRVGQSRNRAVYTVAFDASRKDRKMFEIIWENGYKENFVVDFTNGILMDDLSGAVAPKKLAFNGAVSRMMVGEGQQLDLKITKKQMGDVICILYESSDESVVEVSDRGYVTAVKKGQATVTAYPAYETDGKKEKLTDAKGNVLKGASLKITVSELAPVKGIKTEAHDTYAYLNYTVPAGGYRREIYVLKSSKTDKKTVQDFEDEIGKITNGNYDAFVTKPIYCTGETGTWLSKGVKYYHRITNLEPNQQYTVYVRNAGALRTTDGGCKSESRPAGAVSTFTTTRAQEIGLHAYFNTKDTSVYEEYDEDDGDYKYCVNISARKVPLSVDAQFCQKYDEDKGYSDELDYIWRTLPLTKEDQRTYVHPKLTYYVTDHIDEPEDPADKAQLKLGRYVFRPASQIAAIDKKGMISLKGVGLVYVLAYNADTQHVDLVELHITADADGLVGRNMKLKAGNRVRLTDYLTYKQKKTKLIGYCESGWQDLAIDYVPNDSYAIEFVKDRRGVVKECWITAKKADKAKFEITVNDNTVMKNGGSAAKIVVTSAAVEPVKKLKAQDVVDTFGSVTFTYTANNDFKTEKDGDKLAFRIEVKDSTGKMIRRELVNEDDIHIGGKYDGYADAKHTTYQYQYWIDGLTRLSSYTVSVYAVYGEDQSRAANAKLKTTNIPASYEDVSDQDIIEGGVEMNVSVRDDSVIALSEHPLLKSGNKYTLSLPFDADNVNRDAALMKTDTLTWKSSNTKAATVKANPGSFTAALTAVKKGTATISVTSKVTKKVIAKWVVIVNAAGEAEGYYGDNVQFGYDYNDQGNLDHDGVEVLTRNNSLAITLRYGERRWVAFTAPECGKYRIVVNQGSFSVYRKEKEKLLPAGPFARAFEAEMEKGDTYYFCIEEYGRYKRPLTYTFTAGGTEYATVAIGDGVKVRGGNSVRFIAPADNYYTFTVKHNGDEVYEVNASLRAGESYTLTVAGDSKTEYTVEVTARELKEAITAGTPVSVSLPEHGEVWYRFTAGETGRYTFVTENAAKMIEAELFGSLYDQYGQGMGHYESGEGENASSNNVTAVQEMRRGDTVYIRLTSQEANTATLKVIQAVAVEKDKEQSVTVGADGGTEYVTFEVPRDGEYRFTSSYTKPASLSAEEDVQAVVTVYVNNNEVSSINGAGTYECTLRAGDVVLFEVWADRKDTKVTIGVKEISVIKAELDTPTGAVKVSDGVSEWLAFTAANGAGWYHFNFTVQKRADETVPDATAEFYDADRTVYQGAATAAGSETFRYAEYLEAGTVRMIKLTSSDTAGVSVSMKVTKETVDKLEDGGKYTLNPGEIRRLSWTADREGIYHFGGKITPDNEITVKYSTDPAREGNAISNLDSISGYRKKGETFYLTLIAADTLTADDQKASFEAKVKGQEVISLTAGETKPVDVEPGSAQWVEFTARKTQRYVYTKADADGFRIYKGSSLEDYDGEEISFDGDEKYTAGQKQLFRVENTNPEKKTIQLTIAEVTPVDFVQNQASETMRHGEGRWFRFKADALERYRFTAEAKSGGKNAEAVFTKYTSDLLDIEEAGLYASVLDNKIIKAGAYAYLYVEASITDEDTTGDISVTLKAVPVSQVEADDRLEVNKEKEVTFAAANETKYLEFTAPENGWYIFTAMKDGGSASGLTVEYYKNLEADVKRGSTVFTLSLKKDDKLVIKLTSAEVQKVQVKVQQETVHQITESAAAYSVSDGESLWFSVDSGETLRYFIETFEAEDGLTLTMECMGGSWSYPAGSQSGNGFYYSYVGSVGGAERLIKITAAVAGGDAGSGQSTPKTFKIRKGLAAAETLAGGEAKKIEVAKTEPGHMVWYRFTPEESGRYVIKAGGESNARVREFPNGILGLAGSEKSMPYETVIGEAQAGKERIYAVYYTSKEAKDFHFSIYQAAEQNLTEASPVTVDPAAVEAGEKSWVRFRAPADGRYTFTNDSGVEIYTEKYEAIDSSYGSGPAFHWDDEVCMGEGEEMLFAAYYNSKPEKASFSIKVSSVKAEELSVSETPKQIAFADHHAKWFVFTAPAAAVYQFDMTVSEHDDQTGVSVYRYMRLNDQNYDEIYSGQTYGMSAGEKIYFKMQPYGVTDAELKLDFKIAQTAAVMKLELAENMIPDIAAGSGQWAYFRADEPGFYRFMMSGSCVVGRYDDVDGEFMAEYADGGSFTYGLHKNEALYFKVSNETEETAGEKITITKEDSEIRDLTAGGTDRVTVTDSKTAWYALTVPETGLYRIAADKGNAVLKEYTGLNGQEPVATKSGSYFRESDQGETIYINVSITSSSETEIAVTCTKLAEKNFTGDGEVKFTLNQGEAAVVKWYADRKGYYNFEYRASENTDYKYYDEEEWNSWDKAGKDDGVAWKESFGENGGSRYLILESGYDNNHITVSAAKTVRQLYAGSLQSVALDSQETETFRFVAGYTGAYVFRSENGVKVYAYLRDTAGSLLAADTDYSGEDDNFRIVCSLTAGTEVRLEVHNGSYESDSFHIGVYKYAGKEVLLGDDCSYTESVTVESDQEVWYKFTASKDGFYEFGYGDGDHNVNLKLYAADGDGLGTVLGEKGEYSTAVMKTWLDAGGTVLLRSYYNYYSQGTYQVTVRPAKTGVYETDWSIAVSYGSSGYKQLNLPGGNEAVIACSFSKSGKYAFYADDEELIFELYVDGSKVETESDARIEYEYNAASDGEKTFELRVHKGRKYQAFSGYIDVSCNYLRKEYALPLTGLQDVKVSYGQEAWLVFQAPVSEQDIRYTFTFANTNESHSNTYSAHGYTDPESKDSKEVNFGGYYGVRSGAYGVPAGGAATVYWRIRNVNVEDLALTVTITETSAAPLSEAGVSEEIAAGGEKWYVFKAAAAGVYDFSFASDSSSTCYAKGYQDLSGDSKVSGSSGSFNSTSSYGCSKEFAQGEAIYWQIANQDADHPANITIRMKKGGDAALTLDDPKEVSAVIYPGLGQWFSFRAEEEARYIFRFRNTNEEDRTTRWAMIYAERDTDSDRLDHCSYGSDGGTCEVYVPSGATVYCYIKNATDYDLSAAAAVEKITVHEWTEEPVELAAGEAKWFRYTASAEEGAKYTFTFTSASRYDPDVMRYSDLNTQAGSVEIDQYIVREDGYNYTGTTDCYLDANGTVYWKIANTRLTDIKQVKMKAEKVDITALTSGSAVEIPAYSARWFSFTADQSARHAFTFHASGAVSVYLFTALEAADGQSFDDEGGSRDYFNVTYKGNNEYEGTEDCYIPAGGTVYWKVDNTGSEAAAVKVVTGQADVMEMTADMATEGIEIPALSTKWIRFTAAESARYRFTLANKKPGYAAWFYAYLYEDLSQGTRIAHVNYNTGGSYEYYLEQGEAVYWKVPDRAMTDNIIMTIKAEPIAVEALALAQAKEISLGADGGSCKWMYFDVEETGIYDITVTNGADSTTPIILDRYKTLDSASADRLGQTSGAASAACRYSFSKGKRVYLRVSRDASSDAASAVGTISVEKIAGVQRLVSGTGTEVSVDTAAVKYQWLEFTAAEEGVYRFYSEGSSDPKVWLFDEADIDYNKDYNEEPFKSAISDDNSGAGNNFAKRLEMKAGQTACVLVGSAGFATSLDTTVYVTYVDATAIPVSMEAGKYVLLEYTAPKDGNYSFYSDNITEGDPYAWFFRDNAIGNDATPDELSSQCIASDDDGGGDHNFSKTMSLTAGQTIYIAAGSFKLSSAAEYTVYIETVN